MRLGRIACCVGVGLLTASLAWSQDLQKYGPKSPAQDALPTTLPSPANSTAGDQAVLVPSLKGLRFIGKPADVQKEVSVEGIRAENLPLLDQPEFRKKVEPFLGHPLTARGLNEITTAVVLYYRDQGRPVVDAIVPEQDITHGTVQVVVIEGRVGAVRAEGNQHFSSEHLLGQVRLRPGDTIGEKKLTEDLDWLNRNPFRRSDIIFERGQNPGQTDVVLHTQDSFPLRLYTGYEDTGTTATGESRVFAGFNWGNAFGLDQQLNYQFTSSPTLDQFNTHSGSYVVPLPWRHILTIYGLYSRSRPETDSNFDSRGTSWQISTRYEVPLPRVGSYQQSFTIGTDFKSTNNNLDFGGDEVFDHTAEVAQLALGYHGTNVDHWGSTSGSATVFYSPGGVTNNNDDADFSAFRAGADSQYVYALFDLERQTDLPHGFSWVIRGQAQLADGPLLDTEQLGFGGADSVRGFDEREGNGDSGFILSNELYTPSLSVARLFGFNNAHDSLRALAFADYGIAYNRGGGGAGGDVMHFASVGPGIRYDFAPYLSVRYDYGFRLAQGDPANGDHGRGHLSVVCSIEW